MKKRREEMKIEEDMEIQKKIVKKNIDMNGENKEVEFKINAPQAQKVILTGEFNGWARNAYLLKRDKWGTWRTNIQLRPGRYEYKFIVDGEWKDDPVSSLCVPNSFGTRNSVIEIR
ncbi:MAG: glycoside hydrolase [Nitrospinae bacterium]|nr:glycoside hydrolase [Nitrospinota bacterium]